MRSCWMGRVGVLGAGGVVAGAVVEVGGGVGTGAGGKGGGIWGLGVEDEGREAGSVEGGLQAREVSGELVLRECCEGVFENASGDEEDNPHDGGRDDCEDWTGRRSP